MKFINPTTLSNEDPELRDVMGKEIYSLYHCLQNDLLLIIEKWSNYKFLYVDRHTFERVGSQAGRFFLLVEDALKNDIVLSIARLHDNAKGTNSNRTTIRRLLSAVSHDRPKHATHLRKVINDLPGSMKKVRDKLIAHRDFVSIQQEQTFALDVSEVEARIEMMSNALNAVLPAYECFNIVDFASYSTGDARTLIGEIGIAYRFRAFFEENFPDRGMPPEDLLHILHGSTQIGPG